MITIYDQVFPEWLESIGEKQFYRFPFEYNHFTDTGNPPFFGKCLYNRHTGVDLSPPYFVSMLCDYIRIHLTSVIDPSAEFIQFERVIVNGQVAGMLPGPHVDFDHDPRYYTAVYFLLGDSGDLKFYDDNNTVVSYKKHRLVIFNSGIKHEALAPKQGDWRVTIGINFLMNSKFNPSTISN
jgi:hypothetical protein